MEYGQRPVPRSSLCRWHVPPEAFEDRPNLGAFFATVDADIGRLKEAESRTELADPHVQLGLQGHGRGAPGTDLSLGDPGGTGFP